MAAIATLVGLVTMHIRNCPTPAITDALLRAAREFCDETRYVRESIVLDVVADQPLYTLEPEVLDYCEVCGVRAVEVDGIPLVSEVQEGISHDEGGTDFWNYEPPDQLRLFDPPKADRDEGLKVRLILQPKEDATEIPDIVLRRYRNTIAHGAIYWLASMTKAAWSDPVLADRFEKKWIKEKGHARTDADRGHGVGNFRVRSWGP